MRSFFAKAIILLLTVSTAAAIGFVLSHYLFIMERFPEKTLLENVDVSLLTKGEAIRLLRAVPVDAASSGKITLNFEGKKYTFSPSELGIYIQPARSVNSAFDRTYESSYIKRALETKREMRLSLIYGIDEGEFYKALIPISMEIDTPSVEASFFIQKNGGYKIAPEKIGRELEFAKTAESLLAVLDSGSKEADLAVTTLTPRVLADDLRPYPPKNLLSEFSTYYGRHNSSNRIHNIFLVSSLIDNTIILSGETYSLLGATGDFSKARGFREAYVIIKNELVPEYGGGSCQIASTLYNAALLADLTIVKRHNHGIYFSIYPLGRDATIYTGTIDFQFKNNTEHPILIKSTASKRRLSFKVYGTPIGRSVSFGKPEIIFKDADGKKIVTNEARAVSKLDKPFMTKVIMTVKNLEGKIVRTETIKSYYKAAGDGSVPKKRPEPE
ncbi:MAG: VanW family protein [Candidatus Saganbacteria bacterium]|nr:VanW family protein [Candidatus Saganbacteria bacterium]